MCELVCVHESTCVWMCVFVSGCVCLCLDVCVCVLAWPATGYCANHFASNTPCVEPRSKSSTTPA